MWAEFVWVCVCGLDVGVGGWAGARKDTKGDCVPSSSPSGELTGAGMAVSAAPACEGVCVRSEYVYVYVYVYVYAGSSVVVGRWVGGCKGSHNRRLCAFFVPVW